MPFNLAASMMDITLSPTETAQYVVSGSTEAVLNRDKCKEVARQILDACLSGTLGDIDYQANPLHPSGLTDAEHLNWVFVLDTLNFSFWPDVGQQYDVTYKGKKETGYLACCAAFCKAYEAGVPITSAEWMANVTDSELDDILRSDSGHSIPLLHERGEALREGGSHLLRKFHGQFLEIVRDSHGSAQTLLRFLLNMESFRDMGVYKGLKVSFLKRAQILVADTYGILRGGPLQDLGNFHDIATLTMFADYRVPQVLVYMGCMRYSDALLAIVRAGELIPSGDLFEHEIRGCSIAAVQEIYKEINSLRNENYGGVSWTDRRPLLPIDIDVWLWQYRRQHADAVESAIPFHKTRSIYY